MARSQSRRQQTTDKILAEASEQLRGGGFSAINVVSLMKSVGLTHGGFYGHFDSKEDLLDQALKRGLMQGRLTEQLARARQTSSFEDYVSTYVSKEHRELPDAGCAIPSLVCDAARRPPESRQIMEEYIQKFIATLEGFLDGNKDKARLSVSAMVGAIALARVMTNEDEALALLESVKNEILGLDDGST